MLMNSFNAVWLLLFSGVGVLQKFYDEVCGPNLEDTPYSYKGQPESHTYSYNLT